MHLGLSLLLALLTFCVSPARAQDLAEDGYLLPVVIEGQTLRLEAYAARRRDAQGNLPLAIISHGTSPDFIENEVTHASNHRTIARDLARRGWHAVSVVRRGFGVSEGPFARTGSCGPQHRIDQIFNAYAVDVLAAVEALSKQRGIDASRVMFIGTSTGGLTSLLAASRYAGGRAFAVNMSGGWRSNTCEWQDQVAGIFAEAGRGAAQRNVASRWFYAENDSFFQPSVVEKFVKAYRGAGGAVELTLYPPIGDDGHFIFGEWRGKEKWLPELDAFLAAQNLPHLSTMAIRSAIEQAKVPERVRASAERYLRLPGEKALAITSDSGRVFWQYGGNTPRNVSARALAECNKAQSGCRLLMLNNGPAPAP